MSNKICGAATKLRAVYQFYLEIYMDKNNKVYSAVSDSMKGAVRDFYSKYSKELNLKYGKG